MILRPKEGETLLELRKSFLEMLKSVEASPERSPKISAIKSNEAKNFLVVDLLNEVEQRKVENLIKSKLVFSRPTGFDPAVTLYIYIYVRPIRGKILRGFGGQKRSFLRVRRERKTKALSKS